MNPKVSILVPVYNASQWLRECLDSIVGQLYDNLQVVLVDDGSKDDSLAICREYASRYPFVEVYHQENRGVAAARNALLDKADGEYVLFVDADDWIERDMVGYLVSVIQDYNSDVAICECVEGVVKHPVKCIEWKRSLALKEFLKHVSLRGMLWNKLIRRSLFENKHFDEEVWYGEDALMVWDVLQSVIKITLSNKPLYYYRILPSSLSGQSFSHKKMTALKVWQRICEDVDREYPQYSTIAYGRYGAEATLLLYNAIRSCSADDEKVRLLQKTIIDLLPYMRNCDFVSAKMLWFARIATHWYGVAKILVR